MMKSDSVNNYSINDICQFKIDNQQIRSKFINYSRIIEFKYLFVWKETVLAFNNRRTQKERMSKHWYGFKNPIDEFKNYCL